LAVAFPSQPELSPARWLAPNGAVMDGLMLIASDPQRQDTSFGLTVTPLPTALSDAELAPELLASAKAQLLERLQAILLSETQLTLSAATGLEFVFNGLGAEGPGWSYVVRLIIADGRLLQLMVTFPSSAMLERQAMEDAQRFFSSLQLPS
jgi:hypothetical protein